MLDELDDDSLRVAGHAVSIRTLVTDRLRQAIVTGRFRPGTQLRERELCELTGVSRPSVREALRQLESEGLISSVPHRGPAVVSLTVEQVGHLYALRRHLESYAAREFARLRGPGDVEALKSVLGRLDDVEASGTPLQMLEVGTALYRTIAVGSGNPYLADALATLHNRITLIRFIYLQQPNRVTSSFAALRSLGNAILAGDELLAERLAAEYLDGVSSIAKGIVEAGYQMPNDS